METVVNILFNLKNNNWNIIENKLKKNEIEMETVISILFDLKNNNWNIIENKLKKNEIAKSHQIIAVPNTSDIIGLWYIPNYLTTEELELIKKKLANEIIFDPLSKGNLKSRHVAHYGYNYSYNRTGLTKASPIPDYLLTLVEPKRINDILKTKLFNKEFEQLIINEYKPGQQIAYHIDHQKQFGSVIACLTIGQSVPIKFKKDGVEKIINVEEGSLYIMSKDSRYLWQHSLINNGDYNRYSLTYRFVNK